MTTLLPVAGRAHVRASLRAIARANARTLIVIAFLFAVGAIAGLVPPWLVGRLIDRLGSGAGLAEVTAFGLGMTASLVIQVVAVLLGTRHAMVLGELVFARLRERFMEDALRLPIGLVEAAGTGDLVNRTTQDIGAVSSTVRYAVPQSLIACVSIVLIVVAGFVVSPLIAPAFLVGIPILIVVLRWYVRRATRVYQAEGASYGPMFAAATETVEGARTIDALDLAGVRDASADAALAGYWRATVPVIRLKMVMLPLTNVAFALPVAAVLAWGGWLATQDLVTVGDVAALTLYATQLAAPLETVIQYLDEVQHGLVAFGRVLGVSEVAPEGDGDGAVPHGSVLELRRATFAYRTGDPVVHEVTLAVRPGEHLAVVGTSGAGKTTIARLLAGIDEPDSGAALVGGLPLSALSLAQRRREVVLVAQESHVFAATVAENVRMGDPSTDDEAVQRALAAVGAAPWVAHLPEGVDTIVGPGGHRLDGAQEQQLALARVVVADPHTLILDEATSAMDPRAARGLESALAATLRGRTVIAIAHRLHTAYDADRIAVVDAGRIVELGSHDELLAAGGAYATLWHAWRDDAGRSAAGPES